MTETNEGQVAESLAQFRGHVIKTVLFVIVMLGPLIMAYFLQNVVLQWMGTGYDERFVGLVCWFLMIIWWFAMLKVVLPLFSRRIDSWVADSCQRDGQD